MDTKIQKHNILHVVRTLGLAGAEMMLIQYTKALGNKNFNHFVYCFGTDGPARNLLEKIGVRVVLGPNMPSIITPFGFVKNFLTLFSNLHHFIKTNHIDSIHSHSEQSDILAVFEGKLMKVPVFPTIHNTRSSLENRNKYDLRLYLRIIIQHATYKLADHIIAISQEVKTIICSRYNLDKNKVFIVKNGIVVEKDQRQKVFDSLGHEEKRTDFQILAVGRLTYQKNFELLINAADYLKKRGYKHIKFKIAGKGEDFNKLVNLISIMGVEDCVELLGFRKDVLNLMKKSDLFVMTSRYEGLSIAMIEAFSCGLPIVASDAPGLSGYINNFENGILFPYGDHKALAECILKISKNKQLLNKMSHGARKTFLKEYDMKENIKALLKLYSFIGLNKGLT